jgi:hypothetical protein
MMVEELAALSSLGFNWADTPDSVWQDPRYHIDELHAEAMLLVDECIREAVASNGPSPIGLVLEGQKGVGKTHLLSLTRGRAQQAGGYFFLAELTAGDAFWADLATSLITGLTRADAHGESQLRRLLRRLGERAQVGSHLAGTIVGSHAPNRNDLDAFVEALRPVDQQIPLRCRDTLNALVLMAGSRYADIGYSYLIGFDETASGERQRWRLRPESKAPLERVRDIVQLLALTGPVVIGVDQLDTLVAREDQRTQDVAGAGGGGRLVAELADGLMRLREVTRRTVTVLSCLPATWVYLANNASDSVADRFRQSLVLDRITDGAVARKLVEQRFTVAYQEMGFTPPHPSWPVAPTAFAEQSWVERSPRELLKVVQAHVQRCLRTVRVIELTTFDPTQPPPPPPPSDDLAKLDRRFEELKAAAEPDVLLHPDTEDDIVPSLLRAGLLGWIGEDGNDRLLWELGDLGGSNGELHAQLTWIVDEDSDMQEYWTFRAIAAKHWNAALSRMRKAISAAGVGTGADNRHLVLLRNEKWAKGKVTQLALERFHDNGGRSLNFTERDVRTFWALGKMAEDNDPRFQEWLASRRPVRDSALFATVLPDRSTEGRDNGTRPPPVGPAEIPFGTVAETGEVVAVELAALRRHVAVFAGSGSGKTVLLRRIVEECALRGVSAIVLDPNNDLARLGDAWPAAPEQWGPGDAEAAARYLAGTEVVVWTPGRAAGRPLAFQPLPDFAGALADEDEFAAAVEVAVASLAPPARLTGNSARADIGLAVLRQAVVHHARTGSRSLPGLIEVLADLPEGVSDLRDGRRIGAELAEILKAAMVNDPLFAGGGEPVDPGVLLTPGAGKRARVSVISFIGLPAEEQRQNFVNQLQMELFAWIRRNPAGDAPLGGLFVMDEAQTLAASGPLTASTRSTIVLASQARKYGLGLVFATQAPKGLHNQVVGNAMTQFFGRLNSNAQIDAATELARAKGSPMGDIARLERAQFYVAGETFPFRRITTPLCLTHHPASPLRLEEVLDRARRD